MCIIQYLRFGKKVFKVFTAFPLECKLTLLCENIPVSQALAL